MDELLSIRNHLIKLRKDPEAVEPEDLEEKLDETNQKI